MSTAGKEMHWVRSVAAVIAGFASTFILSTVTDWIFHAIGTFPPVGHRMPDPMFLLPAIYRALFTIVGGYVTARLAPNKPMAHVMVLAALGILGGLAGVAVYYQDTTGNFGPAWYTYSILLSAVPCILIGGWLCTRRSGSTSPLARA